MLTSRMEMSDMPQNATLTGTAAPQRSSAAHLLLTGLTAAALAVALPNLAKAQTGGSSGTSTTSGSVPSGNAAPAAAGTAGGTQATTGAAGPAVMGPAAPTPPPATTASTAANRSEQYQRRIRQAITPEEVRRACAAPSGSLTINDEIVVCAERDPQQRYRVPGEAVRRRVDPGQDSPVAQARRTMDADRGAPIGAGADMTRPGSIAEQGFSPLKLGKFLKDAAEKAAEDEE